MLYYTWYRMKGSKFYKFLILGIFINLIIFTGIYFWNRGKQSIKSIIIKSYLEKLSYTEIKDGVKNWQLIADKAISSEDKILLKGVNINFFKRFRLMGNSGTFNPKTRDIRIEGQVKLWQANGYSLSTDYLIYSHHLGLIFTDAPIIIKGEDINLSGFGMRYFLKEGKLVLSKVKLVFMDKHNTRCKIKNAKL